VRVPADHRPAAGEPQRIAARIVPCLTAGEHVVARSP
jgi:hypothetical protein